MFTFTILHYEPHMHTIWQFEYTGPPIPPIPYFPKHAVSLSMTYSFFLFASLTKAHKALIWLILMISNAQVPVMRSRGRGVSHFIINGLTSATSSVSKVKK